MERIAHPQRLGDRLGEADRHDLSLIVLFEGWLEDLVRFHGSLRHVSADWELVVVENPCEEDVSGQIASLDRVVHIPLRDALGFGAGRNLGLRQATGRIACIVDTSVEFTADPWPVLDADLADPAVGLVGRWGVVTDDGYHFDEADGPDVQGVEGYFMAMRRNDLPKAGLFDPKFRFYRNADIDLSYRVREAGSRTVIDTSLPLVRHTHRLWENTPDRDELSRKNFGRFRQHWF